MRYNKILLILIALFFVVIVAELYYLFVIKPIAPLSSSNQTVPLVKQNSETIPPSPSPISDPDQAFNEGVFDSLRTLRKGQVSSSILTYVLEGTIDQIDYLPEDKQAIDIKLKTNNGNVDKFRYRDTGLLTVINSNNEIIDLFSIKQNDSVAITVEFDMIKIDYQSITIKIL